MLYNHIFVIKLSFCGGCQPDTLPPPVSNRLTNQINSTHHVINNYSKITSLSTTRAVYYLSKPSPAQQTPGTPPRNHIQVCPMQTNAIYFYSQLPQSTIQQVSDIYAPLRVMKQGRMLRTKSDGQDAAVSHSHRLQLNFFRDKRCHTVLY